MSTPDLKLLIALWHHLRAMRRLGKGGMVRLGEGGCSLISVKFILATLSLPATAVNLIS